MWSSGSGTPPLEAGYIFLFAYSLLRSKNPSPIVLTQKTAGPQKPTHWGSPAVVQQLGGGGRKAKLPPSGYYFREPDPGQPLPLRNTWAPPITMPSVKAAVTQ